MEKEFPKEDIVKKTDLDNYRNNGFNIHRQWFKSPEMIENINSIIDELINNKPNDFTETFFDESKTGKIKQIQYLYKYHELFEKLQEHFELLAHVYCNEPVTIINMQLFEKHPKISKPTRAHQDNAYFKLDPPNAITFWLALDDIDEENGCIYYAPKTHLTPTRKHQRYNKFTTFRIRSGVPGLSLCLHEHPEELDEPMIVKAGDLLVHSCNLIHRAGSNNSENRRRRAIGISFRPISCQSDRRLISYHEQQLKSDIELQKVKDPIVHKEMKLKFSHLFEKSQQ